MSSMELYMLSTKSYGHLHPSALAVRLHSDLFCICVRMEKEKEERQFLM